MAIDPNATVTIEEALSLLINLDYVPAGFTVLDMTSAFADEAEVESGNMRSENLAELGKDAIRSRLAVCRSRNELAQALFAALNSAAVAGDLIADSGPGQHSGVPRYKVGDINMWASDRFGLAIRWAVTFGQQEPPVQKQGTWEEVTVKIQQDYKLAWRISSAKWQLSHFREIGLMGGRKNAPNALGLMLLGLSQGRAFKGTTNAHKAQMSRLRSSLMRLTSLDGDPFMPYASQDCWKPRFQLIDDRRNAEERAKSKAVHVPFEEVENDVASYDVEDDAAGAFLKAHDNPL
jgi:hypothetical protein